MFTVMMCVLLCGCAGNAATREAAGEEISEKMDKKEIYFAGGCFWGTEHFFSLVPGVKSTEAGYANSKVPSPSYQEVCSGRTGAAETVKVVYDPDSVSLPFLIDLYFETIDPTILNRQGNDVGTQYRTGIYYNDAADRAVIEEAIERERTRYARPIVVQVKQLENFYAAEDYHQQYLVKNPGGYCHINPGMMRIAAEAKDPYLHKTENVSRKKDKYRKQLWIARYGKRTPVKDEFMRCLMEMKYLAEGTTVDLGGKRRKQGAKIAATLGLSESLLQEKVYKEILLQELQNVFLKFIEVSRGGRAFTSLVFGMGQMSEEGVTKKIAQQISMIAFRAPHLLHMEKEFALLQEAALEAFRQVYPNREHFLKK